MKKAVDQQSHSGSIQKDYQESQLTFEDVLMLHGVKGMPFLDTPELKAFAVRSTASVLKRHDPQWIKEHRVRLIEELELISEM